MLIVIGFFWSFKVFQFCEYNIKKSNKTQKAGAITITTIILKKPQKDEKHHKYFTFLLIASYVGTGSVSACPFLVYCCCCHNINFLRTLKPNSQRLTQKKTKTLFSRAILTIVKGNGWATEVNIYNVVTIQIRFLASSDPSRIRSVRDCGRLPRREYFGAKNKLKRVLFPGSIEH